MQHLIDAVEYSIQTENWYSALTLALTLPDITGKVDNPNNKSGERYANWFDKYVGPKYKIFRQVEDPQWTAMKTAKFAAMGHTYKPEASGDKVFLDGNDCYALRCSFLHEGKSDISSQKAQKIRNVLDDFEFVVNQSGVIIHNIIFNNKKLQLQVDTFCNDILEGTKVWMTDISDDTQKQVLLSSLLIIIQNR